MTFVDACLRGEADLHEIEDFVACWHTTESDLSLPEFLGLTEEEYGLWVEKPEVLPYILFARHHNMSLEKALRFREGSALAARGVSDTERKALIDWLKMTGRLKA